MTINIDIDKSSRCSRASSLAGPGHYWNWLPLLGLLLGLNIPAGVVSFPEYQDATAREYLRDLVKMIESQAGSGVEIRSMQAHLEQQLGRQDQAERLAREGLTLDPLRADLLSFLADLYIRQDRLDEAAQALRQALQLDPLLAGGNRRLGMVLDRLGDRTGARAIFERGIQQSPDDATARLLLGRLLLDENQPKTAAHHLEKACQLDPSLANAFYVLAEAQIRLNDPAAAARNRQIFQELKRKEKAAMDQETSTYDDAQALRLLTMGFHLDAAALLQKQQQTGLVEEHLRQAVRVAPREPQGHEMLASHYARTGRPTEARPVFEALIRLRPRHAVYHLNLGTLLLNLKEFDAAVAELRTALELDPKMVEALNNLARGYLSTRRELPEALSLCRRLVELQPTAANYDLLGWACYANGQLERAREASDQAVAKEPENAVYRERNRRLKQMP